MDRENNHSPINLFSEVRRARGETKQDFAVKLGVTADLLETLEGGTYTQLTEEISKKLAHLFIRGKEFNNEHFELLGHMIYMQFTSPNQDFSDIVDLLFKGAVIHKGLAVQEKNSGNN